MKAAIDNIQTKEHLCVPMTLYLQNQVVDLIWLWSLIFQSQPQSRKTESKRGHEASLITQRPSMKKQSVKGKTALLLPSIKVVRSSITYDKTFDRKPDKIEQL